MEDLERIIETATHDWQAWDELSRRIQEQANLVGREHKHRIDNRLALSAEEVAHQAAALLGVIRT
jgi:hypothetical protein